MHQSGPSGTKVDFAIQVHDLGKRFSEVIAIEHLDFQISAGTIFGLLGPNGAGKSTTIKILTTLLNTTTGSAMVAGFDVEAQPIEVRRRIGYVPQMLSADGALTATENLNLSARLHGLRGEARSARVREAIDFAGLAGVAGKLVRTYSGGMIRRLEIAQATLHYPEVLFLDEPTIGLDPVARRMVWDKLLELRQAHGMTILITTHDMEEADTLCDELAILHQGRLAVTGKPGELKARLGPEATLDDVFADVSGVVIDHGGDYRDVRQSRAAIRQRG